MVVKIVILTKSICPAKIQIHDRKSEIPENILIKIQHEKYLEDLDSSHFAIVSFQCVFNC